MHELSVTLRWQRPEAEIGLVDRAVAPHTVREMAEELARRIASKSGLTPATESPASTSGAS